MFKKTMTRAVAGATSLGLAVGGAVLVGAATAPAAHAAKDRANLSSTEYGLQTAAYGTRVMGGTLGLESGRTAWAWISCTNLAGIERDRSIAGLNIPTDSPMISLGAVDSDSRTFKKKKRGIVAAAESTNSIARLTIGGEGTPKFVLRGLESTSRAWADKKGDLHAKNKLSSLQLKLIDLPEEIPAELREPLDALLAAIEEGLSQVVDTVVEYAGEIEIPGLGKVMVGKEQKSRSKYHAAAKGAVLKVQLYGEDTEAGTEDDMIVNLGRSWARINRDIPVGIFHGKAYGASLELLDGILTVGELGLAPMPCRGTDGQVKTNSTVGLDLGRLGEIDLGAVEGSVMGKPRKNGSAVAWTEGKLASLKLGPLELRGVVGRAKVKQNRKGQIVKRTINGSTLGDLWVDGELQGSIDPSTFPHEELPEGIGVKFFETNKGKRSMHVSAVVVQIDGAADIRLGNAQVRIARN